MLLPVHQTRPSDLSTNKMMQKPRLRKPDDYHNRLDSVDDEMNFTFKKPHGEQIIDFNYTPIASEELETEQVEDVEDEGDLNLSPSIINNSNFNFSNNESIPSTTTGRLMLNTK